MFLAVVIISRFTYQQNADCSVPYSVVSCLTDWKAELQKDELTSLRLRAGAEADRDLDLLSLGDFVFWQC